MAMYHAARDRDNQAIGVITQTGLVGPVISNAVYDIALRRNSSTVSVLE